MATSRELRHDPPHEEIDRMSDDSVDRLLEIIDSFNQDYPGEMPGEGPLVALDADGREALKSRVVTAWVESSAKCAP